jgi:hypothetical protein
MAQNPEQAPKKEPMPRKTPNPATVKQIGKTALGGAKKK